MLVCVGAMALGIPGAASALSPAPIAAANGCAAGQDCTTTQPSTPSWLTLANGSAYLTQQTLTGTAADEYGTTSDSDPTLFGSATSYQNAPSVGTDVIGSALTNLAGTTNPGDAYAVVLKSDRTLDVLGPQNGGYPLAASATVPAGGTLIGVAALGAPPGSGEKSKIVVFTQEGPFYVYDFTPGSPASISLETGGSQASLPATVGGDNDRVNDDPAFTCVSALIPTRGPCNSLTTESPEFAIPINQQAVSVWEAPPGRGEWNGAVSSFVVTYTGVGDTYASSIFAYESDGLHRIDEVGGTFPTFAPQPVTTQFATFGNDYIRASTMVQEAGSGPFDVSNYDHIPPDPFSGSPDSTMQCPAPANGAPPALAVDAVDNSDPSLGATRYARTGTTACASTAGPLVLYRLERADLTGAENLGNHQVDLDSGVQLFVIPGGATAKVVDATADFPCDEYLSQFAAHPTPDGFPNTGSAGYCGPVGGGFGAAPYAPLTGGAAGIAGLQLQYVADDGNGNQSLHEFNASFKPDASLFSQDDVNLIDLSDSANPSLTMLPLDPRGISWTGHLLTGTPGQVLQVPGTSNPVPVALMAAPPYYSGGQQQVTPTATTFTSNTCVGSGTEQSNNVGVFGGLDYEWASDKYEVEALVTAEAAWTTDTEQESCNSFDQSFIAGNFGNNFVADNSLLFRVDTGTNTYLDLTANSLGVGVTGNCDTNHLGGCDPVFVPSGSQYVLQTISQLKNPQPNNFFADDDHQLNAEYGKSLDAALPDPGNPSSYPAPTSGSPQGCAGPPSGTGSGNPGIADVNPFVAPTPPPAPNLLEAPQFSEVSPASGGNEAGTSSTLTYDSTTTNSSSAEFSIGAEASVKIVAAKFGASYSHGWGTSMSQSFSSGTQFSGGVFDFNGFFNPYEYRLYECRADLSTNGSFTGEPTTTLPVFLVDYMTSQSTDNLPLNFVAPNAPDGTVGQSYQGQVFASGGIPNYTYQVTGGTFPPGLDLNSDTGQLSGTPTQDGTYSFTVKATDSAGNHASQAVSVTINQALSITNPLPDGDVGEPYSQPLGAQGGNPPYTFLLTSSGDLPPGLGIDNSTGTIEGTPTATGSYCFSVYVADSSFPQATLNGQTCITVHDPVSITTTSLPHGIVASPYSATIDAAGGNAAGYTFTSSDLPSWLSLNAATGQLTGTPSSPGTYPFTVDLSDGAGGSDSQSESITVDASGSVQAPQITSASSTTFDTGGMSTFTVTTTGSPTAVLNESGTLPDGVTFADNGNGTASLSGAPGAGTAGTYTLTITAQNGVDPAASQSFTLVVDDAPSIATQPSDLTVDAGSDASFTAKGAGVPAPDFALWQLSTDGGSTWVNVFGEPLFFGNTTSTFDLGDVGPGADGDLVRVEFSSSIGSATSNSAKLTVDFAATPVTQPTDATVVAGKNTSFTAAATGEPAPSAQWQVSTDGGTTWTNIAGATSPTLSLNNVPANDDGNEYQAVFTNSGGAFTTNAVTLTVETAPDVTTDPSDVTVSAGDDATFHAAASGKPAPSVQWQSSTDGGTTWNPVSGATGSTLTVPNVSGSDDGTEYEAVFTNAAGNATSGAATLTANTGPAITTQPTDQTTNAGGAATFTAAAGGSPAPSVRWQVSSDGGTTWTDIDLATSPTLSLANVPAADDGNLYRAIFTNAAGSSTTDRAKLTVRTTPVVTTQPTSDTVNAGSDATFTAAASGSPAPTVQWRVSTDGGTTWTSLTGATGPTLTVPAAAAFNGDRYDAVFTNVAGTATTDAATLTVDSQPVISTPPADQTVPATGTATFSAAAVGAPDPSIQWQVSTDGGATWTNISGATAPAMTLLDVPVADDGFEYRAAFANPAGTVTTAAATLHVTSRPSVRRPPAATTVPPGGSTTYTVLAGGTPSPTIQWEVSSDGGKTWKPIPGATSPTLSLNHVSSSQNGNLYRAMITNGSGTTTSPSAVLIVSPSAFGKNAVCKVHPHVFRIEHNGLGRIVRYVVSIDGKRVRSRHGHRLRNVALPAKITAAAHHVRIVVFTAKHYRITTQRTLVGCAFMTSHRTVKQLRH